MKFLNEEIDLVKAKSKNGCPVNLGNIWISSSSPVEVMMDIHHPDYGVMTTIRVTGKNTREAICGLERWFKDFRKLIKPKRYVAQVKMSNGKYLTIPSCPLVNNEKQKPLYFKSRKEADHFLLVSHPGSVRLDREDGTLNNRVRVIEVS
jgi:hypothetical protein